MYFIVFTQTLLRKSGCGFVIGTEAAVADAIDLKSDFGSLVERDADIWRSNKFARYHGIPCT